MRKPVMHNHLLAIKVRMPESRSKVNDRPWIETLRNLTLRNKTLQICQTSCKETGIIGRNK